MCVCVRGVGTDMYVCVMGVGTEMYVCFSPHFYLHFVLHAIHVT